MPNFSLALNLTGTFNSRFGQGFGNRSPTRPLPDATASVPQPQQPPYAGMDESPYYSRPYDNVFDYDTHTPDYSDRVNSQPNYPGRTPGYPDSNGGEFNYNNRPNLSPSDTSPSNSPYSTPESATSPESESGQCKISNGYQNAMPRGELKDIQVTPLESDSPKECIEQCCKLGSSLCQYILVFESKCMAIACSRETEQFCAPQYISGEEGAKTGYYEIMHPSGHYVGLDGDSEGMVDVRTHTCTHTQLVSLFLIRHNGQRLPKLLSLSISTIVVCIFHM